MFEQYLDITPANHYFIKPIKPEFVDQLRAELCLLGCQQHLFVLQSGTAYLNLYETNKCLKNT